MFRVDQPILSCSEDDLGRQPFAKALADAILKHDSKDSIVLGLFGPWGSGKTSILNCVREYIENSSESLPEKKKPVFTIFNPWTYSDQNQLIAQFFRQVSAEIKGSTFIKKAKKIGKILEQFSLIFRPVAQVAQIAVPGVGLVASTVVEGAAAAAKVIAASKQLESEDPEHLKEELDKLLSKLQNKIIVVIDDIDRLNHVEIRQIFQLVKKLADFKNTVYLLAFDKNVVLKALGKVQEGVGEQYLEKIVTVPFDIPNPGQSEIKRLLKHGLKAITESEEALRGLDSYRDEFISLFRNLRDVNRYLNTFRFGWGLIKGDVNLRDFMMITAIQVRYPRLYDVVRDEKSIFTMGYGSAWSKLFGNTDKMEHEKAEVRDFLQQKFEEADKASSEILKKLLQDLFPPLEEFYRSVEHGQADRQEWRREKRICSSYCFDYYFTLSVPKTRLSQGEIEEAFSQATSPMEFSRELNKLHERGHYAEFVDYLEIIDANEIGSDKIKTILGVLMNLNHIRGGPAASRAIRNLAMGIEKFEDRFAALSHAIDKCESSLYTMAWTIGGVHKIMSEEGLPDDLTDANPKYVLIRSGHLSQLESKASKKILEWAQDGRLLDHPKLAGIMLFWDLWADSKDLSACVEALTGSDGDLIKLISSFFEEAASKDSHMPSYVDRLQKFVDLRHFEKRIRNIRQSDKFEKLDGPAKSGIETLVEWYSSSQRQ
jgi:predicted KAP-like P-loop ATPase